MYRYGFILKEGNRIKETSQGYPCEAGEKIYYFIYFSYCFGNIFADSGVNLYR